VVKQYPEHIEVV